MKKIFEFIGMAMIIMFSLSGCGKAGQKGYDAFIKGLPENSYYAQVDIGLEKPVLLVTEDVYDNMDGNTAVTIDAEAYYIVNGEVTNIGELMSQGTAYPLYADENGIYDGGNHGAAKYTFNKESNTLEMTEGVFVQYEEGTGDETYTAIHDGKEAESSEDEFLKFFDQMGKAQVINFTAVDTKK